MWHRVDTVVQNYRLDPATAQKVLDTKGTRDRFSIVNEFGWDEISTWHVNDFVAEVRKQQEQAGAEGHS